MSMLATGSNSSRRMTGGKDIIPKGYQKGQLSQFTPEQMNLFGSLFGQVGPGSFTSRLAGGDQDIFNQIEAPAWRDLQRAQSGIASQFSGMGLGARNSSGHQLAQGQLASDFAQDLQSKRMGLQRQALMDLMGMSQTLLSQRPYERFMVEKQKPFWQNFLTSIGSGAGQAAGSFGMKALTGGLF